MGFPTIRIEAAPDLETNFTLFQPVTETNAGPDLVARIKSNEDIAEALETIARTHAFSNAVIRGSLGSLISAQFNRDGPASLDRLVVDMQGYVYQGSLRLGENLVCITFDLVLQNIIRA